MKKVSTITQLSSIALDDTRTVTFEARQPGRFILNWQGDPVTVVFGRDGRFETGNAMLAAAIGKFAGRFPALGISIMGSPA